MKYFPLSTWIRRDKHRLGGSDGVREPWGDRSDGARERGSEGAMEGWRDGGMGRGSDGVME